MTTSVFKLDIEPLALVSETAYTNRPIGTHASTMELYRNEDGSLFIEWDVPAIDEVQHIGLVFDGRKRLVDYDGVYSLPSPVPAFLRAAGYVVPRDMIG